MRHDLDRLLDAIEAGRVDEAGVYAAERAPAGGPRTLQPRPVRSGVLTCPICGFQGQRFLPFGLFRRRNACCPGCGSVERHRLLWLYLLRSGLLSRRLRVLHTAPEPWLEARLRALPNLRYRSVDRFDPGADLQADLTALPLAGGSVDLILTSHVLEHIPDDRAAMAELGRVLAPGGRMIVMVPFDPRIGPTVEDPTLADPAERMRRFGHPYHYRAYGEDFPARLAAAAGLAVSVTDSKHMLTAHQRRRWRINRNWVVDCASDSPKRFEKSLTFS